MKMHSILSWPYDLGSLIDEWTSCTPNSYSPCSPTIVPNGLQVRSLDSGAEAMLAAYHTTAEEDADTLSQLERCEDGAVAGILSGRTLGSWEIQSGAGGPARQMMQCADPASEKAGTPPRRHWFDLQHARLALEYRMCRKQLLECVMRDLGSQAAFLHASAATPCRCELS